MKNIAVIAKVNHNFNIYIQQLIELLKNLGCNVFSQVNLNQLELKTNIANKYCVGSLDSWVQDLDLAIIMGGDGTLLSVGRTLAKYNTPIIGINFGGVGFMTDISTADMLQVIKAVIVDKAFYVEQRSVLNLKIYRNNCLFFHSIAINDLVLSAKNTSNLIEFEIFVNQEFMCSQRADGVIVATPTGSTAYALAAGGSIIHPHAQVFTIVPICPQSLSNRPVVLANNSQIEIKLTMSTNSRSVLDIESQLLPHQIFIDGQDAVDIESQDLMVIDKAEESLKLLHYNGKDCYNYFSTLRTKLNWSKKNTA